MEVNQPRERTNWRLCQTHNCSANASSTCLTDGVVVCNMCTTIFHYNCDVKIKDGEGFVIHALKTLKDLVETMRDKGMKNRIDKIKKDFREEISHIQDKIKALEVKIARKKINLTNVDNFVKKTKRLAKSIIESHIYSVYTDYTLKLEICGIVPTKLDDFGEMGLHDIRTQFYLKTKKKERDFCEYKLKALAREIDARVGQAKQQSDQKFAAFESRLSQEADSTKSRFEQLEQLMFSKFEQMEKEQSSKLEEVNSRVKRHKNKARKNKKLNEEHKEQLKSNLEKHKKKIDHIENKQEEMKKEIDVTNKNTEERLKKQDEEAEGLNMKIDELAKESSKSMKKLESSIEDTCQKIETSNEKLKKDFELKMEAAKSSIQKDLKKQQEECSKLVEGCNEELKINYSELKQKVETIQENQESVTECLKVEIGQKQLQLKDEQFYRDKLGTNIVSNFKARFALSSGSYNKLGPFIYKPEDFSQPIQLKCDTNAVYIGQFKPATDTLHGIGIRVERDGDIYEGYWKDGCQDGNGRTICGWDCSYYIGTYKEDNYSKGIKYYKDGSIKQTYND